MLNGYVNFPLNFLSLRMVLGQLPPGKLPPNSNPYPNANPKPNPNQGEGGGAIFIGGNCPDTSRNVEKLKMV